MRRNPLFYAQLLHCSRQCLAERGFIDVMTHLLAAALRGSVEMCIAGNRYCQPIDLAAFGYFLASAYGR